MWTSLSSERIPYVAVVGRVTESDPFESSYYSHTRMHKKYQTRNSALKYRVLHVNSGLTENLCSPTLMSDLSWLIIWRACCFIFSATVSRYPFFLRLAWPDHFDQKGTYIARYGHAVHKCYQHIEGKTVEIFEIKFGDFSQSKQQQHRIASYSNRYAFSQEFAERPCIDQGMLSLIESCVRKSMSEFAK